MTATQKQLEIGDPDPGPVEAGTPITPTISYPTIALPKDVRGQQDRGALIEQQRLIWVDGVLAASPWKDVLLRPGLALAPEALQRALASSTAGPARTLLPPETQLLDIYDHMQGSLLVLGEPGSGKTTLLLELMRDLLGRAQLSESHPIPVRFDLSAWGGQQKLDIWFVKQLNTHYGVPMQRATRWVEKNVILPMLDGLDEVAEARRTECAEAIRTYRQERGLWPMVVCCREQEYAALPDLHLNGAVALQPLSEQQIQAHLVDGGQRLAGVRQLIAEFPELIANGAEENGLLTTPLMACVASSAYADMPEVQLQGATPEERRSEMFDAYLKHIFADDADPPLQAHSRLQWLAWQLRRAGKSAFFIEELQLDWTQGRWRHLTTWSPVLFAVLLSVLLGSAVGAAFGLVGLGAMTGLISGVAVGIIDRLLRGRSIRRHADRFLWSWKRIRRDGRVILIAGLIAGLGLGAITGFAVGRYAGWDAGFESGLRAGLVYFVSVAVIGVLYSGVSKIPILVGRRPNAGMRAALRNGLMIGLAVGLIAGVLGEQLSRPVSYLLLIYTREPRIPIDQLRMVGIILGGAIGIASGLHYGLHAALTHALLRLQLMLLHSFPWRIARFCNACAAKTILRPVGGGWIFTHRLLQEHLADQYERRRSTTIA
jgi:DNA polymerase III delta prime subunit